MQLFQGNYKHYLQLFQYALQCARSRLALACSAHQQTRSLLSPSPLCLHHPIPPPTTRANIPQNALVTVLSAHNKIIFLTNCAFIITPSHSNVSPLQNTFSPTSPLQPLKLHSPESLPKYSRLHSYLSSPERPQRHIRLEVICKIPEQ